MGSYSKLKINNLFVADTKRDIDPFLMILFRETDKCVEIKRVIDHYEYYDESEINDYISTLEYRANAQTIIDRLDILGYTLGTAQKYFEISRQNRLKSELDLRVRLEGYDFPEDNSSINYYESITVQEWMENIRFLVNNESRLNKRYPKSKNFEFMLGQGALHLYGFPGYDYRVLLRLILETSKNSELIYDLTELKDNIFDEEDELIEYAQHLLTEDFYRSQKTIILTEGSTDKSYIEKTLNLLYPHLSDYYRFFDYNTGNIPAGTGNLKTLIKSFSNACISNRVIAIFDNDAAGHEAKIELQKENLNDNIFITTYPNIELANNYPTIGPTGKSLHNINGQACSIEIYLGEDVLRKNDGELCPVEWKSKNKKINRYQGEIVEKKYVQKRFLKKLQKCTEDKTQITKHDWTALNKILHIIFSAFNAHDAEDLLSEAIENRNYV
ncbi:HEPN/Toprim-associated domain-containing protein [Maridesulfovibrio sp.]|uniref:HEPN/Toprim-associated domain-containing protein n=1 Tax=Maridesulfovibrio sp. TaxID=2795000 RepID=UPI0029C9C7E3|nr:HEPN/Toprim-associated domain-containing protein [Maridesulfovibrio sp.]